MLLAADDIDRAAEFAQRQLDYAANVSFAAYSFVLFVILVAIGLGVHFWFIVRPDQKQRLATMANQDTCLKVFAENFAVQTLLLKQLDADQSMIKKEFNLLQLSMVEARCPMLTQARMPPLTPPSMAAMGAGGAPT